MSGNTRPRGDDGVVAFAHPDQQGVDIGRHHRETVGVGDLQLCRPGRSGKAVSPALMIPGGCAVLAWRGTS